MNWYDRNILPHLIGLAMRQGPMMKIRSQWVPLAGGDVLEIGFGSGLNLLFYTEEVRSLTALDPSAELKKMAEPGLLEFRPDFDFVLGTAESLPFETNNYDFVVCTWTLCSTSDPQQALSEVRRVLKPDGRLIFAEHGLAPDKSVQRWQNGLNPVWKKLAGGCHLNRQALVVLDEAGFDVVRTETGYLRGPRPFTYTCRGMAIVR